MEIILAQPHDLAVICQTATDYEYANGHHANDHHDQPTTAAPLKARARRSSEYPIRTSQEIDVLHRAQCAGATFTGYLKNEQAGAIFYEVEGLSHRLQFQLNEGNSLAYLEKLIRAQDADAAQAASYILGVLAPAHPLPSPALASGWIDFDDVIKKIGWEPRSTKERRAMHTRIWEFVQFGALAHLVGDRTTKYYAEGTEIETELHCSIWQVHDKEIPKQRAKNAPIEAPVGVKIGVSSQLAELITSKHTAQYLEGAEILGAIPGGKPSGAWARSVGMGLASFWRRNPRESISGTLQPTRRELLNHYAAKVAPYEEILKSDKPGRAIEYWHAALQILADDEYIGRAGEVTISTKAMRADLPRQNWKDIWLDQAANIEPGETMKPRINGRAEALPPLKPRDLSKPRAKRRTKKQPEAAGM
jgi:hypothetical protein